MSSDSMILTVANRLAYHPPFDRLDPELLDRIARGIRIRYLEADEIVFEEGDVPRPEFYVVVKGEGKICATNVSSWRVSGPAR